MTFRDEVAALEVRSQQIVDDWRRQHPGVEPGPADEDAMVADLMKDPEFRTYMVGKFVVEAIIEKPLERLNAATRELLALTQRHSLAEAYKVLDRWESQAEAGTVPTSALEATDRAGAFLAEARWLQAVLDIAEEASKLTDLGYSDPLTPEDALMLLDDLGIVEPVAEVVPFRRPV